MSTFREATAVRMNALPAFAEVKEAYFGQAHKVDCVMVWVLMIQDQITTKAGRERVRHAIKAHALSGSAGEADVLAAAQHWHDADWALRELMVELRQAGAPIPTALGAYYDAAMFRPVTPAPRGGNGDTFLDIIVRDIAICVLVDWALLHWPDLNPERNTASEHPSACSLVAEAMTKMGFKISEGQVGRIYRQQNRLFERLKDYMPALTQR